jgi:hypothetical protein
MLNRSVSGLGQQKSSKRNRIIRPVEKVAGMLHAPSLSVWASIEKYLLLSKIFPPQAELAVEESTGDGVRIRCSWLLLDDPGQPERRSTPIDIFIHGYLADQFRHASSETLGQLNEALARIVTRRLKHYRPDLGLPYHRTPPPFEIRASRGPSRFGLDQKTVRAA